MSVWIDFDYLSVGGKVSPGPDLEHHPRAALLGGLMTAVNV
jgi:hypothetical protein